MSRRLNQQDQHHSLILRQVQASHTKRSSCEAVRNDSRFRHRSRHKDHAKQAASHEHLADFMHRFEILVRMSCQT